jgi:hypothetical protein
MFELFEQIDPARRAKLKLDEASVGVKAGLLQASGKFRNTGGTSTSWTYILDTIVAELRESGQLGAVRPQTIAHYRHDPLVRYVYEFTTATRIHLPVSKGQVARGLPPELTVWVSDPLLDGDESHDEWSGTYLYLVEEGDPAPFTSGDRSYQAAKLLMTGCSALHQLMEVARTSDELTPEIAAEHGRASSRHPLEKLSRWGAHSALPRDIEVLYLMRYMSNELGGWDGGKRRNDLLAYPLAILC